MTAIGREFLEKTKYKYAAVSDQELGLPQPPLQLTHPEDSDPVELPAPKQVEVKELPLREAIDNRKSVRDYTGESLTLGELSFLLWCTQGVKEVTQRPVTIRTVPSAGARHAFETYLLVNNVLGLEPGLYRYLALEHKLLPVNLVSGVSEQIAAAAGGQDIVADSAVTFIWSAVAYRMTWRYGERGYRYLFLDAGHVCQNLYLAVQAVGCGACAIGFFDDDALNALLTLDGVEQFVVYLAAVGKTKK
ncbi:MAG: SagB/ThcOx family dehydrogenase [Firmicutes bacterium]|jgi:SagB-type dehydrogenase family enzyme|nr:SagB/ThcOx family dehydrogenase [Bacillota bacterium]NLO65592.1 SagB/ThcOx family dehydrogenase [Bacillota bacterium]